MKYLVLALTLAACTATQGVAVKTYFDPLARLFCAIYPAVRDTASRATLDASAPSPDASAQ